MSPRRCRSAVFRAGGPCGESLYVMMPSSKKASDTIAGDVAIAGVNIINAHKANAGFEITGSTSGVANGQTVMLAILDNSGQTTFNITATDGSFTHSYTATVNAQGTGWTTTIPSADAT